MTILQLLADIAQAFEIGDEFEFADLAQQAREVLLTSSEKQQVETIIQAFECSFNA